MFNIIVAIQALSQSIQARFPARDALIWVVWVGGLICHINSIKIWLLRL